MPSFKNRMKAEQIEWRQRALPDIQGHGKWGGIRYRHLLPASQWQHNLWPGIRSKSDHPITAYLAETGIQPHSGKHNLLSSWVMCANLYFPFRRDAASMALLAGFLRQHVHPAIESVSVVELEFVEDDPKLSAVKLLGEPGGVRGANQTSPDVAFRVRLDDGSDGLVLVEVKFTEHDFYQCSAYKMLDHEQRRHDCWDVERVLSAPRKHCAQWRAKGRPYLKYLTAPMLRAKATETLTRCPAAIGGYQLLRQQALAEALAIKGPASWTVISALAYYEGNEKLLGCLRRTGVADVRTGWGPLFQGNAAFRSFSHQEWVAWVRAAKERPSWCNDWLKYVQGRYGL